MHQESTQSNNCKPELSQKSPLSSIDNQQLQEVLQLFALPFNDLLFQASQVHRQHQQPNQVQISTLLSIKTGSCPENCKYCPQSAHYDTGLQKQDMLSIETIKEAALNAKQSGASRFCMGAAWRNLHNRDVDNICQIIAEVKNLGLETCMTLGMLTAEQSVALKEAGLDYYNHNIDSSPEFYEQIISTRSFDDRLTTLKNVREAGLNVCSGGIVGMGETREDRAKMLLILANLPTPPESVPINMLVKVAGTPLENIADFDHFEFIRTIAVARILMPTSKIRLSAGREQMNEQTQALCFFAGANSVFYGEKLLTTNNPQTQKDQQLFTKLGINTV
ncbi:MAG: biotin synthase BioB [Proteobacteria bacterium]|jgi:biotin synthase|nr:biotin synthase BioB [Pseudomonadota bacterium]